MLIDCDTCTARGHGCHDCVVTVLLGAPPGWGAGDPAIVPTSPTSPTSPTRPQPWRGDVRGALGEALVSGPAVAVGRPGATGRAGAPRGRVVEFDDVERRAVMALAEVGLVPPLRHQPPTTREVG